MCIRCIWEHNGDDTLLYAADYPGAFTRGADRETAMRKMPDEIRAYLCWTGGDPLPAKNPGVCIIQEKENTLAICDADSDVLFDAERSPLSTVDYQRQKALVLRSAADFYTLYLSVPEPDRRDAPARQTFYGSVPQTAREMYEHTKDVTSYYFGEIGIDVPNTGTILQCRQMGFDRLERAADIPVNTVRQGSFGEEWSLKKVLRRFLWHDRIHARALYRMAVHQAGADHIPDIFRFGESLWCR